jgi:hypothetical protein
MIAFVFWSFALALVPLVLDLTIRAVAWVVERIVHDLDMFPASGSSTCLEMYCHLDVNGHPTYSRREPPRQSR